jgi:uncharacterized protein with HEPN domain
VKDDRLYLLHVSECIAHIQEFTADGKDAFFADRKTQDAVLRNLHTGQEQRVPYPRPHPRRPFAKTAIGRNLY